MNLHTPMQSELLQFPCKTLPQLKLFLTRFLVNDLASQPTLLFQLIDFLSQSQNPSFLNHASLLVQTQHHLYPASASFLHNTLIKAYTRTRFPEQGLLTYVKMLRNGCKPDNFTYPSVVKSLEVLAESRDAAFEGKQIHSHILRSGFDVSVFVVNTLIGMYSVFSQMGSAQKLFDECGNLDIVSWNSLIDGYVKLGELEMARRVFDKMPERNEISWTAIISGYAKNGDLDVARALFDRIPVCRNVVTWNSMINGYAKCGFVSLARNMFDEMPKRNIVTWNSMVSAYAQNGELDEARCLFDEMPNKDVFSWSCIISGYAQSNRCEDALKLFKNMIDEGLTKPNEVTLVIVLSVCGRLTALGQGKWIHVYIKRNGMRLSDNLGAALIDMYAKCGCVDTAVEVFSKLDHKNVSTWNALITGFAINGIAHEALDAFLEMQRWEIIPDKITILGLLMACCHGGLVEEGRQYFNSMFKDYGIQPEMKHYGCLIDLLGRAGLLAEAEEIVESMPMKPDITVLGALLGACRIHGDIEIASRLRRNFLELKSCEAGCHVLYSNIYASAGRWIYASDMRGSLLINQIKKDAGLSSVEAL